MMFSSRGRLQCADCGKLLLQTSLNRYCLSELDDIGGTEKNVTRRGRFGSNGAHFLDLEEANPCRFLNQDAIGPGETEPFNVDRIERCGPVCRGNAEVKAPPPVIRTFKTRVADVLFAVQLAPDL